jgi:Holliday junction resolvase RusA-like endonuclease
VHRIPSTAKPDVDNAGKLVLDAMSARRRKRVIEALVSSVLVDDRCVVALLGTKAYAALHETEHTRIRLWRPCR